MATTFNNFEFSVRPENHQVVKYKQIINQYLTKEEIKQLHIKSDWKGLYEVASVWFWIIFAFALVGITTQLTSNKLILAINIVIALFIIGGKQLGCAIIMHDASHYSLFKSKKLNDIIGNFFGAYPIFNNVEQYRPYHFQHHIATGTDDDPDINLVKGYPAKIAGMMRKLFRDLIGLTGIKSELGLTAMHLGFIKYNLGNVIEKIPNENRPWKVIFRNAYFNLRGPIFVNLMMFLILYAIGLPYLYLLWIGANLTTYNFCIRIRSIAEHSVVEDTNDPYKNTRTTYANFIERLLFAPLHVNYHLEHHFLQNMPSYNSPAMHKMLKERGFYEHGLLKQGYLQIIKMAIIK
ncbi:MAG TPA: fatty acid desaturase family protein [Chitinophagales bacterium]|nr:fatty acid desaturase family protein [Chitinophagales bacterium]HND82598.1 fatty acid desaturase family protein [Chitinophagales bacterium]HNG70466.1 fatty acid desaturase family protein [Chitinophagales bacterium]HNK10896.1 fatty acid desaturase family protein [Chitinophagales bacterium]HNL57953.1 fatty acid desaturase family protein [Chitinophagales bacterium]